MKKQQGQISQFMIKAGQEFPLTPTPPDEKTRILRVKLVLEEALELAKHYGVEIRFTPFRGDHFYVIGEGIPLTFQTVGEPDMVEIADAHADLEYVNIGGAIACGIQLEEVFEVVHASNMSKFIDGHRAEDGKWIKGPSYTPATEGIRTVLLDQASRTPCEHHSGMTYVESKPGLEIFSCNECAALVEVNIKAAVESLEPEPCKHPPEYRQVVDRDFYEGRDIIQCNKCGARGI